MQGITDCTGKVINIGDYIKTPDSRVIQVEGGLVLKAVAFNAAACTVVPKPHGHTSAPRSAGPMSDSTGAAHPASRAAADDTDCVVWGS